VRVVFREAIEPLDGKARDDAPGFPIYEAEGGEFMLTLWLKIVTLVVTVKMRLTFRKVR